MEDHIMGGGTQFTNKEFEESTTLQKMRSLQDNLKRNLRSAEKNKDYIFVFGDLQDVPDGSKNFYYGTCKIPKNPLGIIKTCEGRNLSCSIYQHLDTLEKQIISRHGSRGGRFIDGMYTCSQGLQKNIKALS
jgi:hypothetical protein